MDSRSTPATDSLPPQFLVMLRQLRRGFAAANTCLERTGNTDRELDMMDALVTTSIKIRDALTEMFDSPRKLEIMAFIKGAMIEKGFTENVRASQIASEFRELLDEVGILDFWEQIECFDLAQYMLDHGSVDAVTAASAIHTDFAAGVAFGQEIAPDYSAPSDPDDLFVRIPPTDTAPGDAQHLIADMRAALASAGVELDDEKVLAIANRYWAEIRAAAATPSESPDN